MLESILSPTLLQLVDVTHRMQIILHTQRLPVRANSAATRRKSYSAYTFMEPGFDCLRLVSQSISEYVSFYAGHESSKSSAHTRPKQVQTVQPGSRVPRAAQGVIFNGGPGGRGSIVIL